MNPSDHIADTGRMVSSTITILQTDKPFIGGDSSRICSRCGLAADDVLGRLVVIFWYQSAFVYCGPCRERMGI